MCISSYLVPNQRRPLVQLFVVHVSGYHTRPLNMNNASQPLTLCLAATCPPSRPRRPRNTGSSMRRWWPRPRREVGLILQLSAAVCSCSCPVSSASPLSTLPPAELKDAQKRKKQLEDRCKLEESIGTAAQTWNQEILPNWSTM